MTTATLKFQVVTAQSDVDQVLQRLRDVSNKAIFMVHDTPFSRDSMIDHVQRRTPEGMEFVARHVRLKQEDAARRTSTSHLPVVGAIILLALLFSYFRKNDVLNGVFAGFQ